MDTKDKLAETTSHSLSQSQKDLIAKRIDERVPVVPHCEMCKHQNWSINDRLVSPIMLYTNADEVAVIDVAVAHPSVFLQCANCGNSKIISLQVLKIEMKDMVA